MSATDSALRAGERAAGKPRRWGALYVAEHKLRGVKTWGTSVLATAVGNPVLYLFAFGVGLASLVDRQLGADTGGASYLEFVAPALLVSAIVMVAAEEAMFTIMMGFKWNAIFIAMNAAPISPRQIFGGVTLAAIARMAGTAAIYYVVAVLFGAMQPGWSVLVVPIAVLTGLAVGMPIAVFTTRMEDDRGQFALINRLIIMPLTLFSGTMFPLTQLPLFLQWIGWLSPIWHGAELGRQASYAPVEAIWLTAGHVAFLAVLAIAGFQISVRNTARRLNR